MILIFARLSWPRLFKSWIAKTNCVIHRIVIYSVDSAIHLLNNWNLNVIVLVTINITEIFQVFTRVCFLSLTLIRILLWSPHSFSINGVRLWFKAPLKCRSTNFAKKNIYQLQNRNILCYCLIISVVLRKVLEPSRYKRKSHDEEFIIAQCACINDGATLQYCELIN